MNQILELNIQEFKNFYNDFCKICDEITLNAEAEIQTALQETNQSEVAIARDKYRKAGYDFENKIILLINKHLGVPVDNNKKPLKCRGVNKQQFDIKFISPKSKNIYYIGECKFKRTINSKNLSILKDEISKFLYATFDYIEVQPSENQYYLVLFCNLPLNATIINNCLYNNILFICPKYPYLNIMIDESEKFIKNNKFQDLSIYEKYILKLKNYNYNLFNYKNIRNNCNKIDEEMANYYMDLLRMLEKGDNI